MKLKDIHIIMILLLMIIGCNATKNSSKLKPQSQIPTSSKVDTIKIANDSLEYKIIILEVGFNSWLATQRPRGYYNTKLFRTKK